MVKYELSPLNWDVPWWDWVTIFFRFAIFFHQSPNKLILTHILRTSKELKNNLAWFQDIIFFYRIALHHRAFRIEKPTSNVCWSLSYIVIKELAKLHENHCGSARRNALQLNCTNLEMDHFFEDCFKNLDRFISMENNF